MIKKIRKYQGKIFRIKLNDKNIPILVPSFKPLDDSICDSCTFKLKRRGIECHAVYRYAYRTAMGAWTQMKFVVPVLIGSKLCKCSRETGNELNVDELPEIPLCVYQKLLEDPRSFLETAFMNGYLKKEELENLPFSSKVIGSLRQFLTAKTIEINNFKIDMEKYSYTAFVVYNNQKILRIPKKLGLIFSDPKVLERFREFNFIAIDHAILNDLDAICFIYKDSSFWLVSRNHDYYDICYITSKGVIGPFIIHVGPGLKKSFRNLISSQCFGPLFFIQEKTKDYFNSILSLPLDYVDDKELIKYLDYFGLEQNDYDLIKEDNNTVIRLHRDVIVGHKLLTRMLLPKQDYIVLCLNLSYYNNGKKEDFLTTLKKLDES